MFVGRNRNGVVTGAEDMQREIYSSSGGRGALTNTGTPAAGGLRPVRGASSRGRSGAVGGPVERFNPYAHGSGDTRGNTTTLTIRLSDLRAVCAECLGKAQLNCD
jgi:hypothetical protein